jgi:hypothetical protein
VSLNRCEDALLHYVRAQADEHRYWHGRVLELDRQPDSLNERTARLERELRAYAAERSRSDRALGDAFGAGAVSLRNLAEYLLRTWPPPRPARRPASSPMPDGAR